MHTGLDLGFGCTGIITLNDNLELLKVSYFGSKISKDFKQLTKVHPVIRLRAYQHALMEHFTTITGTVVIEEPMGHLPGKSREIIALKGVYLVSLPLIIPHSKIYMPKPTQIKKCFTGNGKADKDEIMNKCKELGYIPPNDHVADAFAMAYMSVKGEF